MNSPSPVSGPVFFQMLDEKGQMVQNMRSWTMVLPETKLVSDYEKDVRLRFEGVKPICHSFGEYENNPWSKR